MTIDGYQSIVLKYIRLLTAKHDEGTIDEDTYIFTAEKLLEWQDVAGERGLL